MALSACHGDERCERQARVDHPDPFEKGFAEGFGLGVVISGGLAALCIIGTGGVCAAVIAAGTIAGSIGLASTCAEHGCGIPGGPHVGGSTPWSDYERGNLLGGIAGGSLLGGPTAGVYGKGIGWLRGGSGANPAIYAGRSGGFRQSLVDLTGLDPGGGAQAHHVFPNKFGQQFLDLGLDVNEAKYGSWWETTSHQTYAREYNESWASFLEASPSLGDVLSYGRTLGDDYGFEVHY